MVQVVDEGPNAPSVVVQLKSRRLMYYKKKVRKGPHRGDDKVGLIKSPKLATWPAHFPFFLLFFLRWGPSGAYSEIKTVAMEWRYILESSGAVSS